MKKHDLHQLIQSMTKSEKRHFRLHCQRQPGELNYLAVFNILEEQTVFDENSLKKLLPTQTSAGQLHVTKNYLRDKILESLRLFYSKISREAEVRDLLKNVEILFYKELYAQAEDELLRAEKTANTFDLYTAQVDIGRWQRKLEQTLRPNAYERVNEILQSQESALAALENHQQHLQAIVSATLNFTGSAVKSWEPATPIGLDSKVLNYNRLYVFGLKEGRLSDAEGALLELLELLESQAHRVKEEPSSYMTTVANLAGFYIFRKEHARALELLQRCRSFLLERGIPDRSRPVLKQVMRLLNMELEIYRNVENPTVYAAFISETGKYVQKTAAKLPAPYLLSFHFQFAWICFLQRDVKTAIDWITVPLNDPGKYKGETVFRYALLLNLILHLEQRNDFVLRYFVASTRRYFKKSGGIEPWEKELLQFFSRAGQSPEGNWKSMKQELADRLFPVHGPKIVPDDALRMLDVRRWLAVNRGSPQ